MDPPASARHLGATYRLQLRPTTLDDARRLLPYLHDIGVETLYLSPLSTARPGSTHGYDVTDPTTVDAAVGGARAWRALLDGAGRLGMRVLVDVVPNHLAASEHSPWWADVLRHGRRSRHARTFDVDWAAHAGRVLLPLLGAPFDDVLHAGGLSVGPARDDDPAGIVAGEAVLRYGPRCLPLDPTSWPDVAVDPAALGRAVAGRAGRPASWGAMRRLLDRQHWRLAWWRTGAETGNYRRFFDIDDLAGVRVEDPVVFTRTQRLAIAQAADPRVAGLRVDHVDGLADPAGYLAGLRRHLGPGPDGARPVVLVEKILARGERLAPWEVDGTTGYEFTDLAVGLFVDGAGARRLGPGRPDAGPAADVDALRRQGRRLALADLFPGDRRRVATALTGVLRQLPGGHDLTTGDVDWALTELTAGLAVYRTYSATPGTPTTSAVDDAALRAALARAADHPGPPPSSSSAPAAAADPDGTRRRVADALLLHGVADAAPDLAVAWRSAVARWQQLASAVAAKGVEDTALYRFDGALVAADVGGEPADPAVAVATFHAAMAERRRRWPQSLNATSTHDSKWSEDVRARLAAATGHAEAVAGAFARWERRRGPADVPDGTEARRLYQAMIGLWPPGGLADAGDHVRRRLCDRLQAYATKAAREAKVHTSWTEPVEGRERALAAFVADLVTGAGAPRFVPEMDRLVRALAAPAAATSLGLVALKATAPGVPDVYQGCETWCATLVDPDNRGPLDLDGALARWERTRDADIAELAREWPDGRVKLRVTAALLHLRRSEPALFRQGDYRPLPVTGPAADHVVAFARRHGRRWAVTVVPRLPGGLPGGAGGGAPAGGRAALSPPATAWGTTAVRLPDDGPTRWHDVLTGAVLGDGRRRVAAADLFGVLPVAVLVPGRVPDPGGARRSH